MAHLLEMGEADASIMFEALQTLCLLALIIAHYFLIRGCFSIREELPIQGGAIGTKIDGVSEYIDELAQLVSDFTDSMPASAKSHPPSSPIEALLTSFMAGMTKPNHGPTQDEWEILENQENPPNETQDKSD